MRLLPALFFCLATSLAPAASAFAASGEAPAKGGAGRTAAAGDIKAIRDAEARRALAVAERDVDALRALIGSGYYHVETNGRVRSKTEFLQMLARDEYEFRSYGVDDVDIQLLDDGRTAVVTGRLHAQLQGATQAKQWRGRYVRVWVRQADGWRNALHQSTEIRSSSGV